MMLSDKTKEEMMALAKAAWESKSSRRVACVTIHEVRDPLASIFVTYIDLSLDYGGPISTSFAMSFKEMALMRPEEFDRLVSLRFDRVIRDLVEFAEQEEVKPDVVTG